MVSKAADRSSSARMDKSPLSTASRMSERTLRTAVSVEWWTRYADCRRGRRSALARYSYSCRKTSRSSSFDSTDKLDIGRYDRGSSLLRSGFFSSGVMKADLNASDLSTSARQLSYQQCTQARYSDKPLVNWGSFYNG